MGDSGNFIFQRNELGGLTYRGDFEGLYRFMGDPWGQSGEHPRMRNYYEFSRNRLVRSLRGLDDPGIGWMRALEVGCGTGHAANFLQGNFGGRTVHGCDISKTAVSRAWSMFPRGFFFQFDIAAPTAIERQWWSELHYQVVVLNQILWYVLERLPTTFDNCAKLLVPGGHLVIQTAFLDKQEYGHAIVDGWHGLLRWVLANALSWQIVSASYDVTGQYAPYHDGILVLRRA